MHFVFVSCQWCVMIVRKPKHLAPKLWLEVVIFLTAYYPLFLILFIRDIGRHDSGVLLWVGEADVYVSWLALSMLIISSAACLLVGVLMRRLLTHQEGGVLVRVTSARHVRGDMLNFTLPFLVALFAFDYLSWQSILSLAVFLVFMFAFVHSERVSLLNPIFLLLGIRLYQFAYVEVGSARKGKKSAICLGDVSPSDERVCMKETVGIVFIYPSKAAQGEGE